MISLPSGSLINLLEDEDAMSTSDTSTLPIYTIEIGTPGTFTNDATVDISSEVNAALEAAPAGHEINLIINPGTYDVANSILLPSNTSVTGDDAVLLGTSPGGIIMKNAHFSYQWSPVSTLGNYSASTQIDTNISVQGLTFVEGNEASFGTWFTNAEDIDVQNNVYIGGVDGNALVNVVNAVVANNVAFGMDNSAYDSWNGPSNETIEDNTAYIYGSATSGWAVLMNSSPTGDTSNPGNAVNDGIVDNVLSSSWANGISVYAGALLAYGATYETQITQQGNITEGLSVPNSGGAIIYSPVSSSTIQDDSFVGLLSTQGNNWDDVLGADNGSSDSQNGDVQVLGNLILGLFSANTSADITNGSADPATVNNAVLNQNTLRSGYIAAAAGESYLSSAGNIISSGNDVVGSGVIPALDIEAPPTLFVEQNAAVGISGVSLEDTTSATIAVTVTTQFGTLSFGSEISGYEYGTFNGESGIVLSGSLDQINKDLGAITFTSNSEGWDDNIEINASDSEGNLATRYIPVIVNDGVVPQSDVITITPGEIPLSQSSTVPESYSGLGLPTTPDLSLDTVIGASGGNVINVGSTTSIVFLESGNDTIFGGVGPAYIVTGSGNAIIDLLSGGDTSIAGGAGAMTINAATGNDEIDMGAADAYVLAGSGSSTIAGGLGASTVRGGTGSLFIATLPQDGGDLSATLGTGNATVFALSGNDSIVTQANTENVVYLGIGNDSLSSGGSDLIYTGAGNDTIEASASASDSIIGGSGSLFFVAGEGAALVDPANESTVEAGSGNLTIEEAPGAALLMVSEMSGTGRVITVNDSVMGISLLGYGLEPIASEDLSGDTLSATLSDGTRLNLYDPNLLYATDSSGELSLSGKVNSIPWSNIQGSDLINIDNLLTNEVPNGQLDTSLLESAVSGVPIGEKAVLYSDLDSSSGLINNGTVVLDPTYLTLGNPLTGTGVVQIETGSGLAVEGSVASTQTISFTGTIGSLIIGEVGQFLGTVSGFEGYNTIDLSNLPFSETGFATLTSGNVLDVVENGQTVSIQLDTSQSYAGNVFVLSSDGLNGTSIVDATDFTVPAGETSLSVSASSAETIFGNGMANFSATLAADSNVTFNTDGGSGTVAAGGQSDLIQLTGQNWIVTGDTLGGDTVAALANGSQVSVFGSGPDDSAVPGDGDVNSNIISMGAGSLSIYSAGSNDLITSGEAGSGVVSINNGGHMVVDGGAVTVFAASGSTFAQAAFGEDGGQLDFINNSNSPATVATSLPTGAIGGSATIFGGAGGGLYAGGLGSNNSLVGGSGLVTLYSAGNGDYLEASGSASGGQNALYAGTGNATLVGTAASDNNKFTGGSGSDSIVSFGKGQQLFFVGAQGLERLTGSTATSSGATNTYYFLQDSTGGGQDIITNFDLTGVSSTSSHLYINPFTGGDTGVSIAGIQSNPGAGGGVLLTLTDNTMITLFGVSLAQADASTLAGGTQQLGNF